MKNLLLPLLALLFLVACNSESNDLAPSDSPIGIRANQKVDICHNGHIINVSINAVPAHQMHGDPMDLDGDGYFSGPNDCGMPVDCNDDDSDQTLCCPTGIWCGFVTYFNIQVTFLPDCSAIVVFNGSPCQNGDVTWELQSSQGNVFTYLETDLCGINQCEVTVIVGEGALDISYDCTDPPSTGTLGSCVPE